MNMKFRQYIQ